LLTGCDLIGIISCSQPLQNLGLGEMDALEFNTKKLTSICQ